MCTVDVCESGACGKGNFNQTAGSIGTKLENNIRFLIETALPEMCLTGVVLLSASGVKSVFESVPVPCIESPRPPEGDF